MNFSSERIAKAFYRRVNPYRFEKWERFRPRYNIESKRKILVYTDSRGFLIHKPKYFRSPIGSYLQGLRSSFHTDYYLCKHRHTTLPDFLLEHENNIKKYDVVILHLGIVDFSPRPIENLKMVISQKNKVLDKLGIRYDINQQLKQKTFMTDEILEQLFSRLDAANLIYIGCNRILNYWEGNYHGQRPKNINDLLHFDKFLCERIEKSISLTGWSDLEIKQYTFDNIHLTRSGFRWLENQIINEIVKF